MRFSSRIAHLSRGITRLKADKDGQRLSKHPENCSFLVVYSEFEFDVFTKKFYKKGIADFVPSSWCSKLVTILPGELCHHPRRMITEFFSAGYEYCDYKKNKMSTEREIRRTQHDRA
jgi:hypothetical protein